MLTNAIFCILMQKFARLKGSQGLLGNLDGSKETQNETNKNPEVPFIGLNWAPYGSGSLSKPSECLKYLISWQLTEFEAQV